MIDETQLPEQSAAASAANAPEPPAQQVIAKAPDPAQRMATRRHLSAKALERKKERHRNAAKSATPTGRAKHHLGGH